MALAFKQKPQPQTTKRRTRPCNHRNQVCAKASSGSENKPTVLIPEKLGGSGLDLLGKHATVDECYGISHDELIAKIPLCDALIVRSATKVSRDVFEAGKGRLKVVGRAGVGIDNVDLTAATEMGCLVVNAPTANTIAAAEHGIALICALARKVPQADASMKRGEWARSTYVGVSMVDKTLAVFGFGKVGSEVARRGKAMGMKVVAHDPYASSDRARVLGVELVSFDEALSRADYMSLHMPLTQGTQHAFNYDAFSKCKNGVRVVNVARGGVIDEGELAKALDDGIVAGAALDVFAEEPPSQSSPVTKRDDVICTPHLGASTVEAQEGVALEVAEAVVGALNGELSSTAVNAPMVSPEVLSELRPFVPLGERLARMCISLVEGGAQDVKVTYGTNRGEDLDTRLLRAMCIKGLVEPISSEAVNIVNADLVADTRGLRVVEEKVKEDGPNAINSISIQLRNASTKFSSVLSSDGSLRLEGRVTNGTPYVTKVGEFDVDVSLEGNVLLCRQQDQPGMIGTVASLLARNNINVSFMTVGRREPRQQAVMVIGTDETPSKECLDEIAKVPAIQESTFLLL